jgi:hypothetical protein
MAAMAVTAIVGALLAGSGTVNAATGDHLAGRDVGNTYFGIMEFPNGPGICLDNGAAVNQQGTSTQQVTAPREAFYLWWFWPNPAALPNNLNAAALAELLKSSDVLPHDNTSTGNSHWTDLTQAEQYAAGDATRAFWAFAGGDQSNPEAAPFKAPEIALPAVKVNPADSRRLIFSNLALVNKHGTPVPGWPLTYTITGPATFADGTATKTVTSGASAGTEQGKITGNGQVSITVTAQIPGTQVTVAAPQAAGYQGYVVNPGGQLHQVRNTAGPVAVNYDFPVAVSSQAAQAYAVPGNTVADAVTIEAAKGATWMKDSTTSANVPLVARGTLYRSMVPFAQSPTILGAGVTQVTQVKVTFDGPGTKEAGGDVTATTAGFYMWRWQVLKADQGANASYLRADASDDYWHQTETTSVWHQLKVTSTTKDASVAAGGFAIDQLEVTGYPSDHGQFAGLGQWRPDTAQATINLYGPVARKGFATTPSYPRQPYQVDGIPFTDGQVPTGTPVHWSKQVPAVNGPIEVGWDDDITGFEPGGCYVFVYEFAGDSRVAAYASPFNDTHERFCVPTEPSTPEEPQALEGWVTTQTNPKTVTTAGSPIADTATWGDLTAGDVITIEAWVFPVKDPSVPPDLRECLIPENEAEWPEPIPAGTHTVTAKEAKAGHWASDVSVTYDQADHCVAFRETTTAADGATIVSQAAIGEKAETVFLEPATPPAEVEVEKKVEEQAEEQLAFTGSNDVWPVGWAGVAVLTAGLALLALQRRFRHGPNHRAGDMAPSSHRA